MTVHRMDLVFSQSNMKSVESVKSAVHNAEELVTVNSVSHHIASNSWLESLVWVVFILASQCVPFNTFLIIFLILIIVIFNISYYF